MRYRISGSFLPAVEMLLENGETVYTQSGAMAWRSPDIEMETNTRGGLMKGLARMFAGESMFMATYTARRDGAEIGFASTVPGEILPLDLTRDGGMIVQKGSFLCAQDGVTLDTVFTKRASAGLFGGEGFILQQLGGRGMAFLEIDGNLIDKTLAPGETLLVDTGNVAGFAPTVSYEVEAVRGGMNVFFGGEGLFLTRLTGPGRILLQTQNFAELCGRIRQYIPQTPSN